MKKMSCINCGASGPIKDFDAAPVSGAPRGEVRIDTIYGVFITFVVVFMLFGAPWKWGKPTTEFDPANARALAEEIERIRDESPLGKECRAKLIAAYKDVDLSATNTPEEAEQFYELCMMDYTWK